MTSPQTLLTAEEVAEELRLDVETIRRWARESRIQRIKLPGGQYRFRREDVETWLQSGFASEVDAEAVAS